MKAKLNVDSSKEKGGDMLHSWHPYQAHVTTLNRKVLHNLPGEQGCILESVVEGGEQPGEAHDPPAKGEHRVHGLHLTSKAAEVQQTTQRRDKEHQHEPQHGPCCKAFRPCSCS